MSKHTLGPWRLVDKANADRDRDAVQSVEGLWVAQVIGCFPPGTAKANGRLLAAAPSLLAALKRAEMALLGYTHQNDVTRGALMEIRLAIAEAEVVE